MAYAENTKVSIDKTQAQIQAVLRKYGASKFMSGWDDHAATIGFELCGRFIEMRLQLPNEASFRRNIRGQVRSDNAQYNAWEQACRSRWRSLFLTVKAKLEATDAGIETFDEAFMPHIIVSDGKGRTTTAGKLLIPQIQDHYLNGSAPSGLLMLTE